MNRNKNKVWTVIGIIVLCLLLVGLGFGIWVSGNYKTILKQRIPVWVKRGTHGIYNVSVEDISINILTRNVSLTGLKLWPDSARIKSLPAQEAPATTFTISVPSLELEDIRWVDIIADKDVEVGRLIANNPDVKIYSIPKLKDSLEQEKPDKLLKNEEQKRQKIDRLYAGEILINNPSISYLHRDSGNIQNYYAGGGNIKLSEWEFRQDAPDTGARFLYARRALIAMDSFSYRTNDGLYRFSSSKLEFNSQKNSLGIKELAIKTPLTKQDFYAQAGQQQDMFDMRFPMVHIAGLDWQSLMDSNQLIASKVVLASARLEDYFTRLAPPNTKSKLGKFPNQLLLKLPLGVYIQDIYAHDGRFKYTEVNEKTKLPGSLVFDGIRGHISNVTNLLGYINKNGECTIRLSGQFNGNSPVNATFKFPLTDTSGAFSVAGRLRDLDAGQVREDVKALALANIESLHVSSLHFRIEGDESYAKGNVTLLYNDLKVSLLDTSDKPEKFDKKNFLSFIANSFLLYEDNPKKGDAVRHEYDRIDRDPYKSFFNLIWKTIFNCIQKTAVKSDNIEEMLEERQREKSQGKNKEKEKKGFFKRIFGGKDKDKDKKKDNK